MLRAALLSAFLAAVSISASASPPTGEPWLPSPADVARLEAKVTLPAGASPMGAYVRYYAGTTKDGKQIIRGVYLVTAVVKDMHQDARPGVRIVTERDIPEIEDGGCHQVNVEYDVATDTITRIRCNGQA
jgi:hypothetical protein